MAGRDQVGDRLRRVGDRRALVLGTSAPVGGGHGIAPEGDHDPHAVESRVRRPALARAGRDSAGLAGGHYLPTAPGRWSELAGEGARQVVGLAPQQRAQRERRSRQAVPVVVGEHRAQPGALARVGVARGGLDRRALHRHVAPQHPPRGERHVPGADQARPAQLVRRPDVTVVEQHHRRGGGDVDEVDQPEQPVGVVGHPDRRLGRSVRPGGEQARHQVLHVGAGLEQRPLQPAAAHQVLAAGLAQVVRQVGHVRRDHRVVDHAAHAGPTRRRPSTAATYAGSSGCRLGAIRCSAEQPASASSRRAASARPSARGRAPASARARAHRPAGLAATGQDRDLDRPRSLAGPGGHSQSTAATSAPPLSWA